MMSKQPYFDPDLTLNKNRVLRLFVTHNNVTTKELRMLTGVVNVGQAVKDLRAFGWDVITDIHYLPNKFGKLCKVGYYVMSPEHKVHVRKCFK